MKLSTILAVVAAAYSERRKCTPPTYAVSTQKGAPAKTKPSVPKPVVKPQVPKPVQNPKYSPKSNPVYVPLSTSSVTARLTHNSFEKGGDGGGASSCTGRWHSNKELIVALATPLFKKRANCGKLVKITVNGKSVKARVVDECDIRHNCPPDCVDASQAVWDALGLDMDIGVIKNIRLEIE